MHAPFCDFYSLFENEEGFGKFSDALEEADGALDEIVAANPDLAYDAQHEEIIRKESRGAIIALQQLFSMVGYFVAHAVEGAPSAENIKADCEAVQAMVLDGCDFCTVQTQQLVLNYLDFLCSPESVEEFLSSATEQGAGPIDADKAKRLYLAVFDPIAEAYKQAPMTEKRDPLLSCVYIQGSAPQATDGRTAEEGAQGERIESDGKVFYLHRIID